LKLFRADAITLIAVSQRAVEPQKCGTFDIKIDYLRKRIPDPGALIQVLLTDCTRFAFREYENAKFSTGLIDIAAVRPEIVTASMKDGIFEVDCTDGTLEVVARDGAIRLDSGREITFQEFGDVAESYWKEWSERAKEARTKRDAERLRRGCVSLG